VVTTPSAWSQFAACRPLRPERLIYVKSVQETEIREIAQLVSEPLVIGIGGGRACDAAKAIGQLAKRPTILIPSVLSTTAWLNPSASLKRGPAVAHHKGRLDATFILPDLIARGPASLTLGGLVDVMCGFSALADWELAASKGKAKVPTQAPALVGGLCEEILTYLECLDALDATEVPAITAFFVRGMGNCFRLLSGRPLEGGEHLLYYLLEERLNQPLNHGGVIALGMLECLGRHGPAYEPLLQRLRAVFQKHGIPHTPEALGIEASQYQALVREMPAFVAQKKYPYSIWHAA
jgi:glycerol dehydrogenase-like iron-containing ADH family enzyme